MEIKLNDLVNVIKTNNIPLSACFLTGYVDQNEA